MSNKYLVSVATGRVADLTKYELSGLTTEVQRREEKSTPARSAPREFPVLTSFKYAYLNALPKDGEIEVEFILDTSFVRDKEEDETFRRWVKLFAEKTRRAPKTKQRHDVDLGSYQVNESGVRSSERYESTDTKTRVIRKSKLSEKIDDFKVQFGREKVLRTGVELREPNPEDRQKEIAEFEMESQGRKALLVISLVRQEKKDPVTKQTVANARTWTVEVEVEAMNIADPQTEIERKGENLLAAQRVAETVRKLLDENREQTDLARAKRNSERTK
jgi:hypothetical protein